MTTETKRIPGSVWVFLAVLASVEKAREDGLGGPSAREISDELNNFEFYGVSLDDVSLRPVPGGFDSEDVRSAIAGYLNAGYATKGNPLVLTEKGRRELWRQLGEVLMQYRAAMGNIAKANVARAIGLC